MADFRAPQSIPQDLLLIQEFVSVPQPPTAEKKAPEEESDDSDIASSSDSGSEDEVMLGLTTKSGAATDEDIAKNDADSDSSDSSPESSESDSDSSDEEVGNGARNAVALQDVDDDEDPIPAATSGTYFTTKNEVTEAAVVVPETEEIGTDEVMEKVGEICNIIDKVAIIRGLPSQFLNRPTDRTLDSDTLLVFSDRKVMGYIYETFGPTTQPFYQVKFSTEYPLNPERVRIGQEVFHVPTRSHFVFVSQIKAYKGSDASNVHDEEPGDDELEFSDDEAEAAHRGRLKRKRGESRARSAASSRSATPNPTLMRDQELADDYFFSKNAYDEKGPYDLDYNASPASSSSRPAPIPYDDPYGEAYTAPDVVEREAERAQSNLPKPPSMDRESHNERGLRPERLRGRAKRGRERERGGRGRGGWRGTGRGGMSGSERSYSSEGYPSTQNGSNSFAIPQATGQAPYPGGAGQQQYQDYSPYPSPYPSWDYQSPNPQAQFMGQGLNSPMNFMSPPPFVQPHINPRFASAFAFQGHSQQQQPIPFSGQQQPPAQPHFSGQDAQANWADEWTVPLQDGQAK